MAVSSLHFLGPRAAFVGGEENVALVDAKGEISTVAVHGGGILSAASDGKRLVMGGDDVKVVSFDRKGVVVEVVAIFSCNLSCPLASVSVD